MDLEINEILRLITLPIDNNACAQLSFCLSAVFLIGSERQGSFCQRACVDKKLI